MKRAQHGGLGPRRAGFPPVICGGLIEAHTFENLSNRDYDWFPPVICGGLIEAGSSNSAWSRCCGVPPRDLRGPH